MSSSRLDPIVSYVIYNVSLAPARSYSKLTSQVRGVTEIDKLVFRVGQWTISSDTDTGGEAMKVKMMCIYNVFNVTRMIIQFFQLTILPGGLLVLVCTTATIQT